MRFLRQKPNRLALHRPVRSGRNFDQLAFVIQFIYGWNQYLWPLLITTEESCYTLLALLPPVVVVVVMQKQFIAAMTETDK